VGKATKQHLLKRAAALIGPEELAMRLGVPGTLLDAWLRGLASMPDRKLLKLADVIEGMGEPKK
jgi:hypothetical protein